MRQLEPSHYGLQLQRLVDENIKRWIPAPYEYVQELASVQELSEGIWITPVASRFKNTLLHKLNFVLMKWCI